MHSGEAIYNGTEVFPHSHPYQVMSDIPITLAIFNFAVLTKLSRPRSWSGGGTERGIKFRTQFVVPQL